MQWLYFGYLAAVKEQNGAAMSLGRTSTFLDVYLERDIAEGILDESGAQELIDDFVIKLRIVRFLRTPEYDELFSGDPTWVTEAIGGVGSDGRSLVTRTSFRFLQTLYNLGPAPEPNLTVLWSPALPEGFKRFCAQVSMDTSAIQYESDDLLRSTLGDDTAIACCVSAMRVGKDMQFFGARVNLAKALLYAINGGRDELTGDQVAPPSPPITGDVLDYDTVVEAFDRSLDWLADLYVDTLNVIHYMHDKYAYERLEMALHDYPVHRFMACGIAGLSVAADSLSAIKHARVQVLRDETGLAVDYRVEGEYPAYGNNDDRADTIAVWLVETFMDEAASRTRRTGTPSTPSRCSPSRPTSCTASTPATPRTAGAAGEPFAPGANPMNGRDRHGVVASALSVAKLPYDAARDGISLTTTITPDGLGRSRSEQIANLVGVLDGYIDAGRLPHQRQRARPRHPRGRHGAPGALPAADHPGLRLRRQLRPAHPRAAARRHLPHLPRRRCENRAMSSDASEAGSTPGTSPPAWTVRAPGSCCSSPAARCAACTARTPTPGTCATADACTVDEVMDGDRAVPAVPPGGRRRRHRQRRRAAAAVRVRTRVLRRVQGTWACTPPWTPPGSWASAPTTTCSTSPTWCCSTSSPSTPAPTAG